jgi:UDP-N-acetylglucosamine 4,6-dehydratase (inverting)
MLKGKSVLITGGTGSFGRTFVKTILESTPSVRRLIVFSRDEAKQHQMAPEFRADKHPQLRFFIGDVRDKGRLLQAMDDVDVVIHAAALKQIVIAEYNPFEAIKTNILGAQNVIEACLEKGVQRVVALSTDKAAAPINLYGATKLCSDKLFTAANNFRGKHDVRFSVVRYGNVMGSRGSVAPLFLKKRGNGVLHITHKDMTRFNITLEEGVRLVLFALENMWGGEIFVPKIPSFRIVDLAKAIAPDCRQEFTGVRPGEKIHEEMITETDALSAVEYKNHYVILPSVALNVDMEKMIRDTKGTRCPEGFRYCSDTNAEWLDVPALRDLVRRHVDEGVAA